MSGGTVSVCRCAWCGLTAHAQTGTPLPAGNLIDAEFLPEGWDYLDHEELCTGCVLTRQLALERAKAERKDVNKGRGVAS